MKLLSIIISFKNKWQKIPFAKIASRVKTIAHDAYVIKKGGRGLVSKATRYLWKHSWVQFLGISAIIAFLLFFLHLFLGSAYLTQKASADISQKLGFYFYINEPGQNGVELPEQDIYTRVMRLKDELASSGLKVEYYSKDDALKLLQQKIPGVIQNFDKYGISNPLPATLYVTFDDNDQFNDLTIIVHKYTDIVRNAGSIQTKGGFAEQQQRVSNIINITNFSTAFSFVLMIVVCVMIVTFLMLITAMKCRQFWKNIEVEKLLGTHYMTIKMPFLISVVIMLCIAFVLTGILVLIIGQYIGSSFAYLFHTSLGAYIGSIGWRNIGMIIAVEFVLIAMLATSISDRVLTRMIKQI